MKNLFRRNKKSKSEFQNDEILWFPGDWSDRTDIVKSIAKKNLNKYIFAGFVLMDMNTNESFGVQVLEKSEFDGLDFFGEFKDSEFFIRMDLSQSEFIDKKSIFKAGDAILRAGGKSIFAEKSRLVYSAESWNKNAGS